MRMIAFTANWRVTRCLALAACVGAAASSYAQKPCASTGTPETAWLNALWDAGAAAGNFDDWYRNCDSDHANIARSDYPQLNDYGTGASGFQTGIVNAPRNVVGNASLGISGMWGMTRYYGMTSGAASSLYLQYRANQHYFYPAVYDVNASDPAARDLSIAMFPYASQSAGSRAASWTKCGSSSTRWPRSSRPSSRCSSRTDC